MTPGQEAETVTSREKMFEEHLERLKGEVAGAMLSAFDTESRDLLRVVIDTLWAILDADMRRMHDNAVSARNDSDENYMATQRERKRAESIEQRFIERLLSDEAVDAAARLYAGIGWPEVRNIIQKAIAIAESSR